MGVNGVNVTPESRGSKADEAGPVPPSAGDSTCAERPALTLAGERYACRELVPGMPGLVRRAEIVNARQHRVSARADRRALLSLLRKTVRQVLVTPDALPGKWWDEPALVQEVAAAMEALPYDNRGRWAG
jgi:hypothetical protein